ncbi:MAG: hypothetical protein ABIJ31_14350 [Pseudomonadota bacterium]
MAAAIEIEIMGGAVPTGKRRKVKTTKTNIAFSDFILKNGDCNFCISFH